jgi:large subunit ribosomal protein L17
MRHRRNDIKLGRSPAHREALMASLVCSLIAEKRIQTTVAKAKSAQRVAERLVTTARQGTLASRRQVIEKLRSPAHASELIKSVIPAMGDRTSGYTRIMRLGRRVGDNAETALLEWVGIAPPNKRKAAVKEDEKKKS